MDKIIIEGGRPLQGEVTISGAKNAALPILVSSLLTSGWCEYRNVPDLMDIKSIKQLLENLGAQVETEGSTVRVNAAGLNQFEAPYDLVRKMRASILVLGPLVARMKKARVSFFSRKYVDPAKRAAVTPVIRANLVFPFEKARRKASV